ncbi:hypothetical protein R1flu_003510 [Riccia fluitans]|uniref:Mitochondrial inner membrane protease ATP23 n=1 Tax=Riccia fluitans TaxID=41844 RepID=A0ABD1Y9C4_9MARC
MDDTVAAKTEKNQAVCERMIEHSLRRNPTVKFMREALAKAGCPVTEKFFKAENCTLQAGGGFVPQVGISICSNHLLTVTQGEVDMILTHELIHAYDHCRAANLDWTNCQHHACSEIRAANLSGDCKWMLELLRGHTNIRQQHQVCTPNHSIECHELKNSFVRPLANITASGCDPGECLGICGHVESEITWILRRR